MEICTNCGGEILKDQNHYCSIANFKKIPINNRDLLEKLIEKLNTIIKGRRELLYSDLLNLIIREGYIGIEYGLIITWCNYKIRSGKTVLKFNK